MANPEKIVGVSSEGANDNDNMADNSVNCNSNSRIPSKFCASQIAHSTIKDHVALYDSETELKIVMTTNVYCTLYQLLVLVPFYMNLSAFFFSFHSVAAVIKMVILPLYVDQTVSVAHFLSTL